jgi:predicted DNA-binding transcriptional regulator YafY
VLNDDEALAIFVSLAAVAGAGTSGLELPAVTALTKLDRILPPGLRERAAALRAVTLGLSRTSVPSIDTDALVAIALACQRPERLRFDYRDAADRESHRHVEPFRLVFTDRRWYLVALDRDRDDWRTFRVDRMDRIRPTGVAFVHGDVPDAARQVAEGLAVHVYDTVATIRFHAPPDEVERMVPPTIGVLAGEDGDGVLVRMGGDADWIARYLAGMEVSYDVVEPEEVRRELRALGRRLVRDHRSR